MKVDLREFRRTGGIRNPKPETRNPRQAGNSKEQCTKLEHLNFGFGTCFGLSTARGFTLIELMVVVVLIGILTAMIIPEMKGTYGDALLRSTSRDLVNVFNLAYSRAVTLNQTHRVRLPQASSGRASEPRPKPHERLRDRHLLAGLFAPCLRPSAGQWRAAHTPRNPSRHAP